MSTLAPRSPVTDTLPAGPPSLDPASSAAAGQAPRSVDEPGPPRRFAGWANGAAAAAGRPTLVAAGDPAALGAGAATAADAEAAADDAWPTERRRVARPRLVERLAAARDQALVLLAAPPGYGKTGLLAEWQRYEAGRRRFARLALGPMDAEPRRLLALLIGAVRQAFPSFDCRVGPTLPTTVSGLGADTAVPRFLDALADLPAPLVIVFDDYHVLRNPRVHQLVDLIVRGLPPTVQLVVATRSDPDLPLARHRAGGAVLEVRGPDLRFDADEVAALLAKSGVALDDDALGTVTAELLARTEGWPAGVALALRALRAASDPVASAGRFAGTHRDVRDYLHEEVLRHQTPAVRTFLVRTSILRRMTGSLCDAVLDGSGSQGVLEQIERANLFVIPLDAERRGYRYHRAFAEVLRAELGRNRPELVAELHRRASAWFDTAGAHREAAEHALAALRLADPSRRPGDQRYVDGDVVDLVAGGHGGADRPSADDDPFPPTRIVGDLAGDPVGELPGDTRRHLDFGQRLTDRELTILRLLRTRLSQREIADELFVSVNTVKTHSRAIYRKLGVSSRQAATDRARELELLDTPRPGPAARTRRPGEGTDGALAS